MASKHLMTLGLIATFVVYIPVATWLRYSYVPIKEPQDAVFRLMHFIKLSRNKFGYMTVTPLFQEIGDTDDEPNRSPLVIYEDDLPLGPAHSPQEDIEEIGLGRFSHLTRAGFFLSTSDNSDPRSNGRTYWVVLHKPQSSVSEAPGK